MISKEMVDVGTKGFVVLTFPLYDHITTVLLGQNNERISLCIANKKGTLLWDGSLTLSFYLKVYNHILSLILSLKSFLSLFLAKIITHKKEVEKN